MLLAGDEFARTQGGNNNAYCQDNDISWVDWQIDAEGESLQEFVRRLLKLRSRYPILRRNRFLTGDFHEDLGFRDVSWINPAGAEMSIADWNDRRRRCFGLLMDGRAQTSGIPRVSNDASLLLLINGNAADTPFRLPGTAGGRRWASVFDTTAPDRVREQIFRIGEAYLLTASSVCLFALQS